MIISRAVKGAARQLAARPAPRRLMVRRGASQLGDWGDEGDPWIWWPGAIEQLRKQVEGETQAIAVFVSNLRKESGTLVVSDAKLTEWKNFYNEVFDYGASIGVLGLLTGATADRLKDLQRRAKTWHTYFSERAATAGSQQEAPIAPSVPSRNELDSVATTIKHVAIWGGVGLIVWKVASETGLLKDIFKGR